jgi:hypothetical protein
MAADSKAQQRLTEENPPAPQALASGEELLKRYSHCKLCGGRLHFSYMTDFGRNLTTESAKCPECGLKTHTILHKLQ